MNNLYRVLMTISCLISNIAYSMSIHLDEASKAKLLEQVKKENIEARNWPSDVVVRLDQFYKMPDARYFVKAIGSYMGYIRVEYDNGTEELCPQRLGKATKGYFTKEELELLGIQLPK